MFPFCEQEATTVKEVGVTLQRIAGDFVSYRSGKSLRGSGIGSLETGQVPAEGDVVRGGNLVVRSRCTCRRLLRLFQTGSHRHKSHMEKDRDEIISFDRL